MRSPKVSVIVPIYNVARYIEKCVRSLFEQTIDDIEYIFVNDCTPDASMAILSEILKEYPNRSNQVIIINQPRNLGAAQARKDGVEKATGQYIIHCDSDDWVERDMYKAMYEYAVEGAYDIVMCDWYRSDGLNKSKTTLDILGVDKSKIINKSKIIGKLIDGAISGSTCNKLIKKQIYTNSKMIWPEKHMYEDLVIIIQAVYAAKNIGYISQPFYYYYFNNGSICNDLSKSIERCYQAKANIDIIIDFLRANDIYNTYKTEITIRKNTVRNFLWGYLINNPKEYYRIAPLIYPELDRELLCCSRISLYGRLIYLLIRFRIYPIIYRVGYFFKYKIVSLKKE